MRLTGTRLRQIIKEEIGRLREMDMDDEGAGEFEMYGDPEVGPDPVPSVKKLRKMATSGVPFYRETVEAVFGVGPDEADMLLKRAGLRNVRSYWDR